jgi:hypothetical protein
VKFFLVPFADELLATLNGNDGFDVNLRVGLCHCLGLRFFSDRFVPTGLSGIWYALL